MNLRDHIRTIPDFPIPGIMFRDITPLIADRAALAESVQVMSRHWKGQGIELVAAMEARGSRVGGATHSVSPRPACGERSDARSASG